MRTTKTSYGSGHKTEPTISDIKSFLGDEKTYIRVDIKQSESGKWKWEAEYLIKR